MNLRSFESEKPTIALMTCSAFTLRGMKPRRGFGAFVPFLTGGALVYGLYVLSDMFGVKSYPKTDPVETRPWSRQVGKDK